MTVINENSGTTVTKPWGREIWLELNEHYCYKRIYISQGNRTSYQYHERKLETNFVISGTAELWLEDEKGVVNILTVIEGDYFTVLPMRKHRLIALTNLILQEVSTPEVNDVIRIEDDSKRGDGFVISEHNVLNTQQ